MKQESAQKCPKTIFIKKLCGKRMSTIYSRNT